MRLRREQVQARRRACVRGRICGTSETRPISARHRLSPPAEHYADSALPKPRATLKAIKSGYLLEQRHHGAKSAAAKDRFDQQTTPFRSSREGVWPTEAAEPGRSRISLAGYRKGCATRPLHSLSCLMEGKRCVDIAAHPCRRVASNTLGTGWLQKNGTTSKRLYLPSR